jgi:hypothetical protein
MILAAKSWRLREAARAAFGAGQFEQAFELAAEAQEAQRTPAGKALRAVSALLAGSGPPPSAATHGLTPSGPDAMPLAEATLIDFSIPYDRDRQE